MLGAAGVALAISSRRRFDLLVPLALRRCGSISVMLGTCMPRSARTQPLTPTSQERLAREAGGLGWSRVASGAVRLAATSHRLDGVRGVGRSGVVG